MTPQFGDFKRTTIVVDNFLKNPDEVRAFALQQEYYADNRYFRGHRSKGVHLWPFLKENLEQLLHRRIAGWDAHSTNGVFQFCVGGDQLVYHSDENDYAAVLYLTPDAPPSSGTTLYRSKATKGRSVQEVADSYAALGLTPNEESIVREMYEGKLLDKTAWEVVDVIGNVYNRLAIWDSRLVHAASDYFGTNKENGRLFQMFFLNTEKPQKPQKL